MTCSYEVGAYALSGDLFEVTIIEQIRCIERELSYRQRVYKRLVERNRMSADEAEREIRIMRAVLVTLRKHEGAR